MCIAPLILTGVLVGIPIPYAKTPITSEAIEIMSCDKGPGMNVLLAPRAGLYGTQLQYGLELGPVRVIPQAGIVGDTRGYPELPMGVSFMVGGEVMVDIYAELWLSVGYKHISNAGLHHTRAAPNVGLDIGSVMIGFSF